MIQRATSLFPVWAIIFSCYALWQPAWLSQQKAQIVPCLIIIMFGMGTTLSIDDFKRVMAKGWVVGLGVLLQYAWMPFIAFTLSSLLGLSVELTVGMVLVGSVAGGTASNVICYLAKGDVALSISMTLTSTLVGVMATPVLTWAYLGQTVPVPVLAMLMSILKIVVMPVLLGLLINQLFNKRIAVIQQWSPLVSVVAIVYVIGIIVALNAEQVLELGMILMVAVMLHNLLGLLSGYYSAKLFCQSPKVCRTMAIEVGMQNSGLAVALASQYFGSISALPGAIFSIWHNLSGSVLAGFWSRRATDQRQAPTG